MVAPASLQRSHNPCPSVKIPNGAQPLSVSIRAIRGKLKNDAQMRPKYNAQQGQQPSAQGNTLGPWDDKILGR